MASNIYDIIGFQLNKNNLKMRLAHFVFILIYIHPLNYRNEFLKKFAKLGLFFPIKE